MRVVIRRIQRRRDRNRALFFFIFFKILLSSAHSCGMIFLRFQIPRWPKSYVTKKTKKEVESQMVGCTHPCTKSKKRPSTATHAQGFVQVLRSKHQTTLFECRMIVGNHSRRLRIDLRCLRPRSWLNAPETRRNPAEKNSSRAARLAVRRVEKRKGTRLSPGELSAPDTQRNFGYIQRPRTISIRCCMLLLDVRCDG